MPTKKSPPKIQPAAKRCAYCGLVLHRRHVYGYLESPARMVKRKYCDQACMGAAQTERALSRAA